MSYHGSPSVAEIKLLALVRGTARLPSDSWHKGPKDKPMDPKRPTYCPVYATREDAVCSSRSTVTLENPTHPSGEALQPSFFLESNVAKGLSVGSVLGSAPRSSFYLPSRFFQQRQSEKRKVMRMICDAMNSSESRKIVLSYPRRLPETMHAVKLLSSALSSS